MARTREYREVINNSDTEYREEFRGQTLVFAPGGSKVFERREAVALLGQYVPFDREKTSGEKPLTWKPANGKRPAEPLPEVETEPAFVNNANGKTFASKEELEDDMKGFSHLVLREKED